MKDNIWYFVVDIHHLADAGSLYRCLSLGNYRDYIASRGICNHFKG